MEKGTVKVMPKALSLAFPSALTTVFSPFWTWLAHQIGIFVLSK